MEEQLLSKINSIIEDYINYLNRRNFLFLLNAGFFLKLNKNIDLDAKKIEYEDIKMSGYDTFKLVRSFYEKYYSDELKEIKKIFDEGIFDIYYFDELEEEQIYVDFEQRQFRQGYRDGHPYINIPLEGTILDYQRVVHEIRHQLNYPNKGRGMSNDILTEGLSIFDEIIALDFISDKVDDMAYILKNNYVIEMIKMSKYVSFIARLVLLKDKLGYINIENYKLLYEKEGLEDFIQECGEKFKNINSYEDINADVCNWYSFGVMIALFMYKNFKEDENYLNKVKELNKAMKDNMNIVGCLNIIGLHLMDDNIIEKLKTNTIEQLSLINEQATKQNTI